MHSPVPSCIAGEEEAYRREFRSGLHALAQPLTLLQIRLEATMLLGVEGAQQPLLAALNEDVQRACAQFSVLQNLAACNTGIPVHRTRFSARNLLRGVLKALPPREQKIKLQQASPQQPLWVLANEREVQRSLLQAALLLQSTLSAAGVLHVSLHAEEHCACIQLTAVAGDGPRAKAAPVLADTLAEALAHLGFEVVQTPCLEAALYLPRDRSSDAELLS